MMRAISKSRNKTDIVCWILSTNHLVQKKIKYGEDLLWPKFRYSCMGDLMIYEKDGTVRKANQTPAPPNSDNCV